jgi:hypothetical protein
MGEQQRRKKLRRKSTRNVVNKIGVTSCSEKEPSHEIDKTGQREIETAERMPIMSSLWCDSEVVWCGVVWWQ